MIAFSTCQGDVMQTPLERNLSSLDVEQRYALLSCFIVAIRVLMVNDVTSLRFLKIGVFLQGLSNLSIQKGC